MKLYEIIRYCKLIQTCERRTLRRDSRTFILSKNSVKRIRGIPTEGLGIGSVEGKQGTNSFGAKGTSYEVSP